MNVCENCKFWKELNSKKYHYSYCEIEKQRKCANENCEKFIKKGCK